MRSRSRMMSRALPWVVSVLVAGAAAAAGPGQARSAGDASELTAMINTYRTGSAACAGASGDTANALAADPRLSRLGAGPMPDPMSAARAAGYTPAKVQVVNLSGPEDPEAAMQLLVERYCRVLRDGGFNDIGVSREESRWTVVLARPLLDASLGEWREAGREVVAEINAARAQSRLCGSVRHQAAPPLAWNAELARAALGHGRDMAERNYFSHVSRNGMTLSQRVDQAGYAWTRVGENIAAGAGSPAQAVAGWLDSPGHCATLMNPDFSETGVAYAIGDDSDAVIYWVQVFAAPE